MAFASSLPPLIIRRLRDNFLSHRHAPRTQQTGQAWSAHVSKPRRTDNRRCFVVPIDSMEILSGCLVNPFSRSDARSAPNESECALPSR